MIRSIKRNSVYLVFFASYLTIVALALIEFDKQYYQDAKRDLIHRDIQEIIKDEMEGTPGSGRQKRLMDLIGQTIASRSPAHQATLEGLIDAVLAEDNIIYRMVVKPEGVGDGDAAFLLDRPERAACRAKMRRFNNFSNSLLLRDFSGMAGVEFETPQKTTLGWLQVYYTTPLDDPAIERLTRRYQGYAALVVLALSALAGLIAYGLLVPLRHVTHSLERSTAQRTVFVPAPRSRLERFYNRMALDAVFARLQGQLRGVIARRPEITAWEVAVFVCEAFREQTDAPLVACFEMASRGPGDLSPTGRRLIVGDDARDGDALLERIEQAANASAGGGESREWTVEDCRGVMGRIAAPDGVGVQYVFALGAPPHDAASSGRPPAVVLERLMDLAHSGLETLAMRNRLLVKERGRANISLSRNLGHDLTNIIATSKLELMALERLLGDGAPPLEGPRREILIESLQGLFQSVRFMQATVDLYRAYAYLQRPALDVHEANPLIEETLELFALSTSRKVELQRELAADAPRAQVDPRLIKLALFNLFANAVESIRKADAERTTRGTIRVVTRRAGEGALRIVVEDNGTGILDGDGRPMPPHEVGRIFEMGYTSARDDDGHGEGLGLNWVRTIVQDLHGGTIRAENLPERSGARFILTFPPIGQQTQRPT